MSKDILGEYGNDSSSPQAPRATNGGQCTPKPIPYSEPVGPKGIGDPKSPGLHGTNHGCCVMQGKH
jgi:hypothetical protein